MPYREAYTEALKLLGIAFDRVAENGMPRPVLVGGAAVEFYTQGFAVSGDFDLASPVQNAVEKELRAVGFQRPRTGQLMRGLVHPDLLFGVEVVATVPFGGKADKDRYLLVDTGSGVVQMIAPEDIIADRMGQHASPPGGDPEMLGQAVAVYKLADSLDLDYLEKRIQDETSGRYSPKDLEKAANA